MDAVEHVKFLVEKATNDTLPAPDWDANLEVCDYINYNQDGFVMQQTLKAIKRRFRTGRPHVQMLSLTLLDTCVQNCGPVFHERLAGAELWTKDMREAAIDTRKCGMQVQEKVLQCIAEWRTQLRPHTFREAYTKLQRKGTRFPAPDPNRPPTRAPGARPPPGSAGGFGSPPPPQQPYYGPGTNSHFAPVARGAGWPAPPAVHSRPRAEQPAQVRQEIEQARQTTQFLAELLEEIQQNDPAGITQEHVYDLAQQCLALKFSMSDIASYELDEARLAEAIAAHEALERVVDKYSRMLNYSPGETRGRETDAGGGAAQPAPPQYNAPPAASIVAPAPAAATANTTSLIDELLSLDDPTPVPAAAPPPAAAAFTGDFGQPPAFGGPPAMGPPPGAMPFPGAPPAAAANGFESSAYGAPAAGLGGGGAPMPVPVAAPAAGNPFADSSGPAFPGAGPVAAASQLPPFGGTPGSFSGMGSSTASPTMMQQQQPQSEFCGLGYGPAPGFPAPSFGAAPAGVYPQLGSGMGLPGGPSPGGGFPSGGMGLAAPATISAPSDAFDEIVRARTAQPSGPVPVLGGQPAAGALAAAPQGGMMYPPLSTVGAPAAPAANPFESPRAPGLAVTTLRQDATVPAAPSDPFDNLVAMRSTLPY